MIRVAGFVLAAICISAAVIGFIFASSCGERIRASADVDLPMLYLIAQIQYAHADQSAAISELDTTSGFFPPKDVGRKRIEELPEATSHRFDAATKRTNELLNKAEIAVFEAEESSDRFRQLVPKIRELRKKHDIMVENVETFQRLTSENRVQAARDFRKDVKESTIHFRERLFTLHASLGDSLRQTSDRVEQTWPLVVWFVTVLISLAVVIMAWIAVEYLVPPKLEIVESDRTPSATPFERRTIDGPEEFSRMLDRVEIYTG